VCLTQVVSADEIKDDEEYEDIMEDMRLEAGKYGNIQLLTRNFLPCL
jgi:splicing factor U2AF subunit